MIRQSQLLQHLTVSLLLVLLTWTDVALSDIKIQNWRTRNGAKVYFVPAPELPLVDARVIFDAGGARDGNKPGLARLTNSLLTEGAGKLSADQIAERLDRVGAQISAGSLRDMAWVAVRTLTDELPMRETIGTLSLILGEPDFNKKAFKRQQKQMLISLDAEDQSPSDIADRAYFKAVYGKHPYASSPAGTRESLKSIKRKDVIEFHKRYYVAKNAVIAITGDLTRLGAEAMAEVIISSVRKGSVAALLPPVKPLEKAVTRHIEYPSTQTHISIGQAGITRNDPDYFPLYVGNHTLGGSGLISRLMKEVREKRGYSYSVYSYFSPMRAQGPFELGLQSRNDKAEEARRVAMETLNKFINQGISDEELEASKKNITGGFALRLDSNKKIVQQIAAIGFYRLPLDYLNTFKDKVNRVTKKDIQEAFKRRLDSSKMVTIMVGPKNIKQKAATGNKAKNRNKQH